MESKFIKGQFSPDQKPNLTEEKARAATERLKMHREVGNQVEEQVQSEVQKIEDLISHYTQSLENMKELQGDERANLREKLVEEINVQLGGILNQDNEKIKMAQTKLEAVRDQINRL